MEIESGIASSFVLLSYSVRMISRMNSKSAHLSLKQGELEHYQQRQPILIRSRSQQRKNIKKHKKHLGLRGSIPYANQSRIQALSFASDQALERASGP